MPKPSKIRDEDPKHQWVCEDCGTCHTGVNPPDKCSKCAFEYFENLHDIHTDVHRKYSFFP